MIHRGSDGIRKVPDLTRGGFTGGLPEDTIVNNRPTGEPS